MYKILRNKHIALKDLYNENYETLIKKIKEDIHI